MRRLANAALWLIAPTYAAWRSAKLVIPRPLEPFRRWNPKAMRWSIGSLVIGMAIIGVAFRFEIPLAGLFGVIYASAAMFKLAARLVVPRPWVRTEIDFIMLTSLSSVTRAALWAAFLASLVRSDWIAAFALGVAATLLSLGSVVTVLVTLRIAARRSAARL